MARPGMHHGDCAINKTGNMKFTLLTVIAAPLAAWAQGSSSSGDGDEPAVLLRGSGAIIATDGADSAPAFGIPEFLSEACIEAHNCNTCKKWCR